MFLLSIFFRFVLAVRSPAFKAMFSQMEQVFQEVSVDASTEALKAMVKYMYTDCLDDADITEDLMKLAEKYELMQLKELCLPLFVKKIRVDNCLKVKKIREIYSYQFFSWKNDLKWWKSFTNHSRFPPENLYLMTVMDVWHYLFVYYIYYFLWTNSL